MSNMVVRTNVFALNAHRNLTNVGLAQRQSAQRLSSGYRINSAADDSAGLAISETMRAQIRGLDQASVNTQDGVGLIQTAEGAMATISEMVIRVRELMVQAANDTNTLNNRNHIQAEIDQIMSEINDVTFRTQFNTRTLLAGGLGGEGGGPASQVSLNWMLFDQARIVGIRQSGGIATVFYPPGAQNEVLGVLPNVHPNPNDRTNTSMRAEVIRIQNDLNDLSYRVARRMYGDPSIAFDEADLESAIGAGLDFSSLSINESERYELQLMATRLESLLRSGNQAAADIFRITQDQINALGGSDATNIDGTNVFNDSQMMDIWNGETGALHPITGEAIPAAETLRLNINDAFEVIVGPSGTLNTVRTADADSALESMQDLLDAMIGRSTGDYIDEDDNFLNMLEQLFDTSFDILGNVKLESNAMWFQTGANAMQGTVLQLKGIHTGVLGGRHGDLAMLIDVRRINGDDISQQLDYIRYAENMVNTQRAQLGAIQNRMEFTRQSLDVSSENLQAAESRVRDTDMAREMMRFTKAQVLQQAGISMLAQANQLPSSILQLLN